MITQVVAVVTGKDDDGLVGESKPIQRGHHAADLRIHERGRGMVGLNGQPALIIGGGVLLGQRARVRGGRRAGEIVRAKFGQNNLVERIKLKIFLGRDVGRVRPVKANSEKKGLRIFLKTLEQTNRLRGPDPVTVISILPFVIREPTQRGA